MLSFLKLVNMFQLVLRVILLKKGNYGEKVAEKMAYKHGERIQIITQEIEFVGKHINLIKNLDIYMDIGKMIKEM